MYFFSETDPNHKLKGSRDPLGFQSLWARAGHMVVKHLSTVSVNLRDFMILSYAFYFYQNRNPREFLRFFFKFEQACAFARNIHNGEGGFNGIEFVNKTKEKNPLSFSSLRSDTLLSNQRAYGIYGKYIRPYRDMGINNLEDFQEKMQKAIANKARDYEGLQKLVRRILDQEVCTATHDELKPLANILKTITPEERELYRENILKVPGEPHPQNDLYEIIKKNEDLIEPENFKLHALINDLRKRKGGTGKLKNALLYIQHTDRVLHPINRIFIHLLSKSSWSRREIRDDEFFQSRPERQDFGFADNETMRYLNDMLSVEIQEFMNKTILRNEEICGNRGNRAWVQKEQNGKITVLYGENTLEQDSIDIVNNHEFSYFLDNYLGLYKQIEKNK